ncbi:hypothetical protein MG293_019685 [Ovis ammon polii]|uniref:Uncharacterized protein n=1 Tax=Ovis ammon polii TaxID=230172 RepID=A0AAD4TP29_OVIAM|nr:hypothetical protein MG293_019685 [Ovis ammon polii]KAI4553042.1 hypothetical protein MJT46_016336 [Ovis ammon polii x Ovis aries]
MLAVGQQSLEVTAQESIVSIFKMARDPRDLTEAAYTFSIIEKLVIDGARKQKSRVSAASVMPDHLNEDGSIDSSHKYHSRTSFTLHYRCDTTTAVHSKAEARACLDFGVILQEQYQHKNSKNSFHMRTTSAFTCGSCVLMASQHDYVENFLRVKSHRFSDPNFPWCKMNSMNSKKRFKIGLAHSGPVRMNKVRVLRAWLSALWNNTIAAHKKI